MSRPTRLAAVSLACAPHVALDRVGAGVEQMSRLHAPLELEKQGP